MTAFTKFTSIESFAHIWKYHGGKMMPVKMEYAAKIKLHGTNAAIRIDSNGVSAQKRTADITPDNDNAGFAAWLEPRKDAWRIPVNDVPIVFHGEWAGPGVQKGDAVSLLNKKYFFIFAVQIGDRMFTDPEDIERFLPEDCADMDDVIVLPWHFESLVVDFGNAAQTESILGDINSAVDNIGMRDPFIYGMFGVEGPGEGLVWVPKGTHHRDTYASFIFKTKSAHHGVKKVSKPATRNFEVPENAKVFLEMFVTEARLNQGLHEACGGVPDKKRTGDFLKWFGGDVKKESEVELSEAGLEWKQVAQLVNKKAAEWFLNRCNNPFEAA